MREALKAEQSFFLKHHAYSAVAHEQGIHFLSRRLNQILENHIRLHMPEISKKVKYLLREAYEVQERYGSGCGDTHREQRAIVVSAIHRFCEAYREIMSGHARNSTKELYGPARIREIFTKDFRREIESMNSSELTDADIHTARRNAVGVNADLFVPNAAFEVLVKKLIQKMEEPATLCVRLVREELKQVLEDVTSSCNEIGRFEELKEKVNQECMRLLWGKTKEAGEFVTNIVDMEVAYINTENPGFDKFRSGVYKLMAAHHSSNADQQARAQAEHEAAALAAAAGPRTAASTRADYLVRRGGLARLRLSRCGACSGCVSGGVRGERVVASVSLRAVQMSLRVRRARQARLSWPLPLSLYVERRGPYGPRVPLVCWGDRKTRPCLSVMRHGLLWNGDGGVSTGAGRVEAAPGAHSRP